MFVQFIGMMIESLCCFSAVVQMDVLNILGCKCFLTVSLRENVFK